MTEIKRPTPGELVAFTPDQIKEGPPESFGWLRRPELDHAGAKVWEQPNGKLAALGPAINWLRMYRT